MECIHYPFFSSPDATMIVTLVDRVDGIPMGNSFVSTCDKCKPYVCAKYFNIIPDLRQILNHQVIVRTCTWERTQTIDRMTMSIY